MAPLLIFYGSLLLPAGVLAVRDLPRFHLPLRANLQASIADQGLPRWDSSLHGGQPILSNPNYAAFYPATWLTLPLPPAGALHLTLLLHALLGMAGAHALARHLGCRPLVATLAMVAFTGSGAIVASTNTFTLYCGLAWWPWIVLWGDRAWRASTGSLARTWMAAAAAGLALQLLAGEPVAVLLSGLTLAALAVDAGRRSHPESSTQTPRLPTLLGRLGGVALLATLLAGIQLLPTLHRLTGTARGGSDFAAEAGTWSMAPARLAELIWPQVYGDPHRAESGFYFGSHLHDGAFPYVISIYPGLLLTLVGLAALLRWPIPRALAWRLAAGAGLLLALGRHLPFFPWLQQIPPLSLVRYPEKFILVTTLVLGLAGALGLELLLRERATVETPRRRAALPLGFALVVTAITSVIALALALQPEWAQAQVLRGSLLTPSAETLDVTSDWLRRHWWWATLWTLACLGWLAWLRGHRGSPRTLALAALVLVTLDLGVHALGSQRLLPSSRLTEPPETARQALAAGGRLFSDLPTLPQPDLYLRRSDEPRELGRLRVAIERLEPYIGTVWGLDYVFHPDYDRMLTQWGRRNLEQLQQDWRQDHEQAMRLLGAWSVGSLVRNRPLPEQLQEQAERSRTGDKSPVAAIELRESPYRLPRVRPVPEVHFYDDAEAALRAARADGYRFPWREHAVCLEPGCVDSRTYAPRPRLSRIEDHGHRVEVDYQVKLDKNGELDKDGELDKNGEGPDHAYLVFSRTFDPGWRARVGENEVDVYVTASGQIGVEVPAGEHQLVLQYRQPGLGVGILFTLFGMLVSALLLRGRTFRDEPSTPGPGARTRAVRRR